MWHTKMHFSAKCNSGRIAIQWFHIKHYLDYQYTKFQPYTFRVQKMCVFARYATLVPRLRQKRNAPRRTARLSEKSQVLGHFSLYQFKGLSGTVAYTSFVIRQPNVLKKIGHEPSGSENMRFIILSCWISSSNGNRISRSNYTQTLILCQLYL